MVSTLVIFNLLRIFTIWHQHAALTCFVPSVSVTWTPTAKSSRPNQGHQNHQLKHSARIITEEHQICHCLPMLTTVCTMWGLCMRKLFTVWNTSNSPSALTRSKILLSAMNVPVRPAPALQRRSKGTFQKCPQYEHSADITSARLPAVYNNRMIPRLLLLPLNWGDDVDHTFPLGGNAHLRPAVEVEVSDRSRLLLLWGEKGDRKRLCLSRCNVKRVCNLRASGRCCGSNLMKYSSKSVFIKQLLNLLDFLWSSTVYILGFVKKVNYWFPRQYLISYYATCLTCTVKDTLGPSFWSLFFLRRFDWKQWHLVAWHH